MNQTPRVDSTTDLTPRQRKAVELLETGAVALVPGRDFATVRGSGKAVYHTSKQSCDCPDYRKRGADLGDPDFLCKHREALKALCTIARLVRADAKATGRCVLPAVLGLALAAGAAEMAARSARLAELLADTQDDLFGPAPEPSCRACAYPLVDGRGAEGLCPKCYSATRAA